MKQVTCSYCDGQGTCFVQETHYDAQARPYVVDMKKTCPQCNGRKFIEIPDKEWE